MSDEMTELLPCPFCGGETRMLGTKERWFNPACSNSECGCEWTDSYVTEAEAIAAWNTRITHGTLTAEQVEKVIHDCSTYASYDGCTYYASGIRLQEIADELNARAERTCRIVEYADAPIPVCSECGAVQPDDYAVYYCWSCGAKVRDE